MTILGCALRLPIYVVNDGRIRKAIFRAALRLRYCGNREHLQALATDGNLEKWSIVIVSNSLRSNLTGAGNVSLEIVEFFKLSFAGNARQKEL